MLLASKPSARFAKPPTKRCSAYKTLDKVLSHIFAKRWATTAINRPRRSTGQLAI